MKEQYRLELGNRALYAKAPSEGSDEWRASVDIGNDCFFAYGATVGDACYNLGAVLKAKSDKILDIRREIHFTMYDNRMIEAIIKIEIGSEDE